MSSEAANLSRTDRLVLHARVRVGAEAPRLTVVFNIEEALRLCSLPGENGGRTYYFRHLQISGLPESEDRQKWLDAFQKVLFDVSQHAVHGLDASAAIASAVYFVNEQEACQALLSSALKRLPMDAWFWSDISEAGRGATPAMHAARVIEKLSRSEASWLAVAAALFTAGDPISLLGLFSDEIVRGWLEEMGDRSTTPVPHPSQDSISLPAVSTKTIMRAAATLGGETPHVVWLASLAIIQANPTEINSGRAVGFARRILKAMEQTATPRKQSAPTPENNDDAADIVSRKTQQPGPHEKVSRRNQDSPDQDWKAAPPRNMQSSASDTNVDDLSQNEMEANHVAMDQSPSPSTYAENVMTRTHETSNGREMVLEKAALGAKTQGAGLYFLLNALIALGIENAQVTPQFLAHLFRLIARQAGTDDKDPILLWTLLALEESAPQEIDQRQLRWWTWKLRRWCWKQAKVPLAEVVKRPGVVTLTRTDLDVSLSLDSVDIRIRRIGLDLDPGWLPWFGRVVRFHYVYSGELQ